MTFPVLLHQDSFDRSNGSLEGSTFSDTLGTWATVEGTWSVVTSNIAECTSYSDCGIFDSAMADATDQAVEVVVNGVANGGGVIFRHNGATTASAATYYVAFTIGGQLRVSRYNGGGSFTNIALAGDIGSIADGQTLRAVIVGSGIELFANGVSQGTCTDSTYSTGKAGLYGAPGFTFNNFAVYTDQVVGQPMRKRMAGVPHTRGTPNSPVSLRGVW